MCVISIIFFIVEIPDHAAKVDLLTQASSNTLSSQPFSDLEVLERSLQSVTAMIDRVLSYVQSVLRGEVKGDPAVGRYLMDTLGGSTEDLEKGGFHSSLQVCFALQYIYIRWLISRNLQDTLMVSYLANLVRSQAEVSARLALVTA